MAFADIFFGTLISIVFIIFIIYQWYQYRKAIKGVEPINKKNLVVIAESQFTEGHVLGYEQEIIPTKKGNRLISYIYPFKIDEKFQENPHLIPYVVGQHRRELLWRDPSPDGTDLYFYYPRDESTIDPRLKETEIGKFIALKTSGKIADDQVITFYIDKVRNAMFNIEKMKGNEAVDYYIELLKESMAQMLSLYNTSQLQPPQKPKTEQLK